MRQSTKMVILGLTNSGKSSVAEILKDRGWPVLEVDDEAQMKNDGIWPEDEEILDKLFKEVNTEVLKMKNIIFVTSFLEIADLKKFKEVGFEIVEIYADYEELQGRKIKRDGHPEDNFERFNRNYNNYQRMRGQMEKYFDLSLNTTGVEPVVTAGKVESYLGR